MKNDTLLCALLSSDHLGDAKMSKRHLASSNLTFLQIAIDENGFAEGQIYKEVPQTFNCCLGVSYDLSKFSHDFITLFDFERP